mmetsp:Transcript_23257/g.54921  ORF Transcript_23257/g.54921 Transcript_23257/m.54921 type:complete len:274 (+) Transcript_23257:37-858(+)|eukprot:s51_g17.t1
MLQSILRIAATRSFASSVYRQKSALVTGGVQGLGEAIARRLAADGYKVVIADVQDGQPLAEEIKGKFVKADVTDPKQVEAAVKHVVEAYGSLDALVNNAGVVGSQVLLADYDVEEWRRVIDINLNGVFYGLKYGLKQMVQQETGGSIVNMSSTAGFRGLINLGPYTAAKFAIRGITRAAAVEYGSKKIRVNALAPTACETPMVKTFIEQSPDPALTHSTLTGYHAIPALPQATDVADACSFLLSDQARYITGHTLAVDAGALSRVANAPERFT